MHRMLVNFPSPSFKNVHHSQSVCVLVKFTCDSMILAMGRGPLSPHPPQKTMEINMFSMILAVGRRPRNLPSPQEPPIPPQKTMEIIMLSMILGSGGAPVPSEQNLALGSRPGRAKSMIFFALAIQSTDFGAREGNTNL